MSFKNIITGALNTLGSAVASTGIPLISGVGSALSAEMGKIEARDQLSKEQQFNADQAQLNRDFQREERELTQQWNTDMWEKEKAYNSPANQLKLAMEAGINPNAVFGSGSGFVAANAPSTSPMSGSTASSSASLADSMLTLNPDIANLMAQTRKTDAEAKGQEIANSYAPRINETTIEKMEQEIGEIAEKKGFTAEQTRQLKELFPLVKGKNEEELAKLKEDTKIAIEELRKIKAEANSAEAQASFDEWARKFRERYGVAPNSGVVDGLIQLAVSGEKGAETVNAIVDTLFTLGSTALSSVPQRIFKSIEELPRTVMKNVSQGAQSVVIAVDDLLNLIGNADLSDPSTWNP